MVITIGADSDRVVILGGSSQSLPHPTSPRHLGTQVSFERNQLAVIYHIVAIGFGGGDRVIVVPKERVCHWCTIVHHRGDCTVFNAECQQRVSTRAEGYSHVVVVESFFFCGDSNGSIQCLKFSENVCINICPPPIGSIIFLAESLRFPFVSYCYIIIPTINGKSIIFFVCGCGRRSFRIVCDSTNNID